MTKLYVGNLPFTATEESVRNLFAPHGTRLVVWVSLREGILFASSARELSVDGSGRLLCSEDPASPSCEPRRMRGEFCSIGQGYAASALATLQKSGVADRCTFVAGNFLESVPENGDVYVLKWILIDWDDASTIHDTRINAMLTACASSS